MYIITNVVARGRRTTGHRIGTAWRALFGRPPDPWRWADGGGSAASWSTQFSDDWVW